MAAAKSDSPATTPPVAAPSAAGTPALAAAPVAAAAPSPIKAWLPVLAALVLGPVVTFAAVEFVVLPRLTKKLTTAASEPAQEKSEGKAAKSEHGSKEGKEGKEGKGSEDGYEFQNVVVNLAGTMGTRYLKTSFLVTGGDATIKETFEGNKPRLTDVTLNVLSSLTLADLEEPGSKNVIREKLVTAYNTALGHKVAEQVYFSDFVIQ